MFVGLGAGVLHGVPDHGVHDALLHDHGGQEVGLEELLAGGAGQGVVGQEPLDDVGLLGALVPVLGQADVVGAQGGQDLGNNENLLHRRN